MKEVHHYAFVIRDEHAVWIIGALMIALMLAAILLIPEDIQPKGRPKDPLW